MSYVNPQDYSKQIASLLSEGLDAVTGMTTEPTIVTVKEAIKNVARKTGVSESVIKTILEYEYEKINKRNK